MSWQTFAFTSVGAATMGALTLRYIETDNWIMLALVTAVAGTSGAKIGLFLSVCLERMR